MLIGSRIRDLYDDDVLLWSERQAALLRRIAAGEPVNEQPDWPNIIGGGRKRYVRTGGIAP